MNKLLTKKEALEIINGLHDEYGLPHPWLTMEYDYNGHLWALYKKVHSSIRIFRWTWIFTVKDSDPWERSHTLEDLVTAVEHNMSRLDPRVDKANSIRLRHAARLLDKELEK